MGVHGPDWVGLGDFFDPTQPNPTQPNPTLYFRVGSELGCQIIIFFLSFIYPQSIINSDIIKHKSNRHFLELVKPGVDLGRKYSWTNLSTTLANPLI